MLIRLSHTGTIRSAARGALARMTWFLAVLDFGATFLTRAPADAHPRLAASKECAIPIRTFEVAMLGASHPALTVFAEPTIVEIIFLIRIIVVVRQTFFIAAKTATRNLCFDHHLDRGFLVRQKRTVRLMIRHGIVSAPGVARRRWNEVPSP